MTGRVRLVPGDAPTMETIQERFRAEGLSPHSWGNAPGDTYGWHRHDYDKVLYCVRGAITFHGRDGDYSLAPGDRLEIQAGTDHAATVGPEGVECMEAAVHPSP
ncbi:MAG TPA: cupin domain-containing protein [Actinomycetota bacterium]|nr:cupin domain-containing protein [Actinomycetota bacterium]